MDIKLCGLIGLLGLSCSYTVNAAQCSTTKMKEILAPATKQNNAVDVDCSFTLKKTDQVTKQLRFRGEQASHLQLDCQQASLYAQYVYPSVLISAVQKNAGWSVPHDIQIKNCIIENGLRIQGMAQNGQGALLKQSSYQQGHTQRVQAAAPHSILLDNLRLVAGERNMLYLAPGVHDVTIQNSQFMGKTANLALYLDAESKNNLIKNNIFDVETKKRELIAVDGSAYNQIINNQFNQASNGAIFLYRNCGEGGVIRHQTPSHNQILNNTFKLQANTGQPQIWIASRNGDRKYCHLDQGYALGSSQSDLDHAQYNIVKNNTFILSSPPIARLKKWLGQTNDLIKVSADLNTVESNPVKQD